MVFDKLRYQSWDIAICPDGPMVVEVNAGSAFNLSQLAAGRGILTDRFRAFLERCGYFEKASKSAKSRVEISPLSFHSFQHHLPFHNPFLCQDKNGKVQSP